MSNVLKRAGGTAVLSGLLLGACLASLPPPAAAAADTPTAKARAAKGVSAPNKHVEEAIHIVQEMRSDAKLDQLLQQARGVFLVPSYTRVAVGVGGGGGAGLLLTKLADGSWSEPAFYHVGAISVGLQVGAESGHAALILNSSKAVDRFKKTSNFSLNADAGVTVVKWSAAVSAEMGDIVAWSSREGLFGNAASVGVSDIRFSQKQTNGFYGHAVSLDEVLAGRTKTGKAEELRKALPAATGAPAR